MNNDQNFGSFGGLAPDAMAAIKNALNRREQGNPVPALDTQSAAGPNPSPLPATPQGNALPTPQLGQTASTTPTGITGAPQVGNPEAKLIISALRERLKAISTIETGGL